MSKNPRGRLLRRFQAPPRRSEEGQAMVLVLVLVVVLALALSAAGLSAFGQGASAARQSSYDTAQQEALSGADWVYAELEGDGSFLGGAQFAAVANTGRWFALDDGAPVACGTPTTASQCFMLTGGPSGEAGNAGVEEATVAAVGRAGCDPSGGACSYAEADASYRQWSFFDALGFDEYESLDPYLYTAASGGGYPAGAAVDAASQCDTDAASLPSLCVLVPYTSDDIVDGPLRTNSSSFVVCGDPDFEGGLIVTGTGGTSVPAPWGDYASEAPAAASASSGPVGTPAAGSEDGALPYSFPFGVSPLAQIAAPGDVWPQAEASEPSGDALDVVLDGTTYSVYDPAAGTTETGLAWPAAGVVYVDGDAEVSGVACRPVSVAASGSIYVPDDLLASSVSAGTGCTGADGVVGLEAGNGVGVACYGTWSAPAGAAMPYYDPSSGDAGSCSAEGGGDALAAFDGGAGEGRTVDAAIVAIGADDACGTTCPASPEGGSLYVVGYDSEAWTGSGGADPPTLDFDGALAEEWRGAYGTYDGDAAAPTLVTGYAKDFTWDQALLTTQPPYFVQPTGSDWEQVGTPLVAPCASATACSAPPAGPPS